MKYTVRFSNGNRIENLGQYDELKDAQVAVQSHTAYKKSWFGKKGNASINNPNVKQRYRIWDNVEGCYWSIRS